MTSGLLPTLKDQVLPINTEGRCNVTGMTATGIPPHIDLARQVAQLQEENRRLRETIAANHIEVMNLLPEKVTTMLKENIVMQGVQQMSVSELKGCIFKMFEDERARERQLATASAQETPSTISTTPNHYITTEGYGYWMWNGKFRPIPPNYELPRCILKSMCDYFLYGVPSQKIKPFRMMTACDFKRADQQYFVKASAVFSYICRQAVQKSEVPAQADLFKLPMHQWDILYGKIFHLLVLEVELQRGKRLHRPEEKFYTTAFEWLNAKPKDT
jgi:hypothetical protein